MATGRIVVDPIGCGCTDCLTRESYPADNIPAAAMVQLISGRRQLVWRGSRDEEVHVRLELVLGPLGARLEVK